MFSVTDGRIACALDTLRQRKKGHLREAILLLEAIQHERAARAPAAPDPRDDELARIRHEVALARDVLARPWKDRADPSALLDRIERAWHHLEVALAEATAAGDGA